MRPLPASARLVLMVALSRSRCEFVPRAASNSHPAMRREHSATTTSTLERHKLTLLRLSMLEDLKRSVLSGHRRPPKLTSKACTPWESRLSDRDCQLAWSCRKTNATSGRSRADRSCSCAAKDRAKTRLLPDPHTLTVLQHSRIVNQCAAPWHCRDVHPRPAQ